MASNWSKLSEDLLTLIAKRLVVIKDYIQFGAICILWRSVYIKYQDCLPRQLPLLMIHTNYRHNEQTPGLFYNLSDNRIYDYQVQIPCNLLYCRGSCFGWLVFLDENFTMYLFNPFLSINNEIELPSLTGFKQKDVKIHAFDPFVLRRVVLSANPTSTSDYAIMVLYGGLVKLAFFKPGDKTWTPINRDWECFDDLIFYKGQFCVVHKKGQVLALDISFQCPKQTLVAPFLPTEYWDGKKYLVELLGDLLQVGRLLEWKDLDGWLSCTTIGFKVFKLDRVGPRWVDVKSLCGHALFLGNNSSISILASDFPGCKPNCIYFTNDDCCDKNFVHGPINMGVFNLEDGRIEKYYPIVSPMIMPMRIWIEPTLQRLCN